MRRCTPERTDGFTLVELVLAVAIIGAAFLTLLYLRTEAQDRAFHFNRDRKLQRYAQWKLDELVFAVEEDIEGEIEGENNWFWTSEVISLGTTGPELLEVTLTLTYPEGQEDEGEYRLSTWFFPDPTHPLLERVAGDSLIDDELGR